ncbi:hypothetical protein ACIQ57_06115 [Lysinibacillus xylanilyticus]|uniref:hypothetical protein n=1 Tax=Lysinibacillus xylanilyticus TaxID=582475 RepID=UPI00381FFFAD
MVKKATIYTKTAYLFNKFKDLNISIFIYDEDVKNVFKEIDGELQESHVEVLSVPEGEEELKKYIIDTSQVIERGKIGIVLQSFRFDNVIENLIEWVDSYESNQNVTTEEDFFDNL